MTLKPAMIRPQLADLIRYQELLRNLVSKELKLKYRGSVIGILWSLVNPMLMIIVYSIAFHFIIRIDLANYPFFIIIGILHWNFFSSATTASTEVIIGNANLIHKVSFPRILLPMSTVIFHFIHLLLGLIAFALAYLPLGGHVWPGLFVYPVILILQALFVIGVAMAISALTVFYRDLKHLVEVSLMLMFWLTPIIYNFTMIPEFMRSWFRLNPMVSFTISYQDLLYLQTWPSIGNWSLMIALTAISLSLGYWIFQGQQPAFAEEL